MKQEEEDDVTMMMSSSHISNLPPQGRIARLHFACRAELPIGSVLRVTGSSLLYGNENSQDDSSNSSNNNNNNNSGSGGTVIMTTHHTIPLFTTPKQYPLWKTKNPVVVVLYKPKGIQHHYYRYVLVTPGGSNNNNNNNNMEETKTDENNNNNNEDVPSDDNSSAGSLIHDKHYQHLHNKSKEPTISSMGTWENPFQEDTKRKPYTTQQDYLANLPYRTLDIDVTTGQPIAERGDEEEESATIRIDSWNNKDDVSFQPYLIREAINREKTNLSESGPGVVLSNNRDDGNETPPPPMFGPHQQRIFFVCFHLPVVVVRSSSGQWRASWTESLLAKTEGSQVVSKYNAHWIGTVKTQPPVDKSEEDKEEVRKLLATMNCTPIFLPDHLRQAHYFGFCKQILWPAFHNVDILDLSVLEQQSWDQAKLLGWYKSYQLVNQEFATLLQSLLQPNDIVWVHDYHLSLLPKLLHNQEAAQNGGRPLTRKVFFLHIPFPTSQIFRELQCGEDLLEGMLHANVIGFHAFDHARHFLNAAKRILGLSYETLVGGLIGVHIRGRTVMVTMANVSIEPLMTDAALMLPSIPDTVKALRDKHGDRTIVGGLDIGQRLQGIALKFIAYERLLHDYPTWTPRVVMLQRVLLPGSRAEDEQTTVAELRKIVQRIRDTYGEAVVDYQEILGATNMPMDQRLALWKATDVLMATPIREGLNHWPMEYVYAHKEPEKPGVVIASEFSAVSSILNGALRVNPYDTQTTVITIDKALSMDLQEREGRRYRDIDFVSTSPSARWVKNVLRDLKDAIALQQGPDSQSSTSASTPAGGPFPIAMVENTTAAYLAREANLAFIRVNHAAVKRAYKHTQKRVFILDFNGTIIIKEPPGKYLKREILGTSGNKPQPHVVEALTRLSADPKNTVYVVSGDSAENVLNAVGHVPGLGLGVSNGAHFSPPSSTSDRSWYMFDLGVDWDAVKRVALPVLSKYTARSNGSFVKLTRFSIGWSYYSCDPEWGSMQASHLVQELESELAAFDVRFVTLKGVVEIVPRRLNKGLLVKKVLRDTGSRGTDFILCMGDDVSDEKMFTSVYSHVSEMGEANANPLPPVVWADPPGSGPPMPSMTSSGGATSTAMVDPIYTYTVAVGKKPSNAALWMQDAEEVGQLLLALTGGVVPPKEAPKEKILFA